MSNPPDEDKPSGRLISKNTERRPATAEPPEQVSGPSGIDWSSQETLAQPMPAPGAARVQQPKILRIPKQLGPYAIKGELARGGMGIVLEAFHTRLHRDVAIKLLRPEVAENDDQSLDRFMREARATAKLRHAGIVAIHDVVHDDDDRTYLVMDFVRGRSLKQVLAPGPMAPQRAAEILLAVTQAVAHAHEHGILHRDLKPDNVLIDDRTRAPLLTDFGLAKGLQRDMADTARASGRHKKADLGDAALTQVGEVIGTPLYMAPEQIDPDLGKTGPGIDVYALGAVLYECLTGRPPFLGESVYAIFDKALRDPPPSPRSLNPLIPAGLERIVLTCLEKRPADRYDSALALAQELERFLNAGNQAAITRRAPSQDGAHPGTLIVCATLLFLAAAWFGVGPGREWIERRSASETAAVDSETEGEASTPGAKPTPRRTAAPTPTPTPTAKPAWKLYEKPIPLTDAPRLARKGFVDAQVRFGLAILRGKFPTVERPEGAKWLERAARTGYPDAITQLAAAYQQGIGVERDPKEELRWLRFGAERKLPKFAFHLGMALVNRGEAAAAQPWLEAAVTEEPKNALAALTLAGVVKERDPARAVRLWKAAAEHGSVQAMLHLAVAYQRGDSGVKRDLVEALAWLTRAARKDNPQAQFLMGRAYEKGLLGLRMDTGAAARWYRKAAAQGSRRAARALRMLGG